MTVDQQPDGSEEDFYHLIHQEMIHSHEDYSLPDAAQVSFFYFNWFQNVECTTDTIYYVFIIRIGQG